MTNADLNYWGDEFRRLRVRQSLGITFETFLKLDKTVRHNLRAWMHQRLERWRENRRWMQLASSPYVLDWSADVLPIEDDIPTSIEVDVRINHITN